MLARLVPLRSRRTPDQVDQPGEGIVDTSAEQVEIGDEALGGDVVGARLSGLTGRVEIDPLGALQHLRHRQSGGRLGVGGVRLDQALVLLDRPVDVVVLQRLLGGGVTRVEQVLALLTFDHPDVERLVSPADALGGEALRQLVEQGPDLVELQQAGDGLRRGPPVEDHHHEGHLRDLKRLRDRRGGVDVDQTGQEAAVVLVGSGRHVVGHRGALG